MTIGSGTTPICGACGLPISAGVMWIGGAPYHYACTHGPALTIERIKIMPPAKILTEEDVRRIVREELAARGAA